MTTIDYIVSPKSRKPSSAILAGSGFLLSCAQATEWAETKVQARLMLPNHPEFPDSSATSILPGVPGGCRAISFSKRVAGSRPDELWSRGEPTERSTKTPHMPRRAGQGYGNSLPGRQALPGSHPGGALSPIPLPGEPRIAGMADFNNLPRDPMELVGRRSDCKTTG